MYLIEAKVALFVLNGQPNMTVLFNNCPNRLLVWWDSNPAKYLLKEVFQLSLNAWSISLELSPG
jgi:hypothetical protein